MTAEDAIDWVDKNVISIKGHTKKYLPFVPYDQEDFLQDAREAALLAASIATKRKCSFLSCFWITLKNKISEVTPNPESCCRTGSTSPPSTMYSGTDHFVSEDRQPSFLDTIDMDRLFLKIENYLSPIEKKIMRMALGIDTGRKGIREISREIGCSAANVRQALNRSCRRITKMVERGELNIQYEDLEYQQITHVGNPMEVTMTLGKRIRIVRGERTIHSFIKKYGICSNTLINYEADRRKPDSDFLSKLCEKEGIEPNWLLGFQDEAARDSVYKRTLLEMVADEATRQATFHIGPKMGKLLTLAYERALVSKADKRQIEEIVSELLELLDSYSRKGKGSANDLTEQPRIAC